MYIILYIYCDNITDDLVYYYIGWTGTKEGLLYRDLCSRCSYTTGPPAHTTDIFSHAHI